MIKILSTAQVREADEFTIKNEPVASIELMERACLAFVDWLTERFSRNSSILVVCGTGNNGGDGLGIARILNQKGYRVVVALVRISRTQSLDFKENLARLPKKVELFTIGRDERIEFPKCDILIDAIFGSGLSRPVEGFAAEVISKINEQESIRIAVDCPSGLMMDSNSSGPSVKAHHTVAFQIPKLALMFPQSHASVGNWTLVDIGLSQEFINGVDSHFFLIDTPGVQKILKHRKKFDHKGTYGHALIIAGSLGKIGANILATKAALRTGSGLVTSMTPSCGYTSIQTAVPEAMVITDPDIEQLTLLPDISPFNAIGIGPGIGSSAKTVSLISELFTKTTSPCVLDADAINILTTNNELMKTIPKGSILTPHPGEFKRLAGSWNNDFERLEKQMEVSLELNAIVILKGAHTSIATPDGKVFFNSTGNPAMATGGSGDVLTGIITALLAQGYSSIDAAIFGVFLHGLAGDLAVKSKTTVIASDLVDEIPHAIKWLLLSQ